MRHIKGFRIITIPLGLLGAYHELYIKQHHQGESTLFVGNVDYLGILTNKELHIYLDELFGNFGSIESILISEFNNNIDDDKKMSRNARFAHILYVKKKSLRSALTTDETTYNRITENISLNWGIKDKCDNRSKDEIAKMFPLFDMPIDDVREEINETMKLFEEKEELAKVEALKRAREADDEGWIAVKPSKKTRKLDAGLKDEARRGKGNTRSRGAKKTKDKTLQNFYRFQLREGKESELQELRRKFEADKQKVADMKMKKRLNPLA